MKEIKLLFTALSVLFTLTAIAGKPVLKFKDNKFRIIQFTDLHWVNDAEQKDDSTFSLIRIAIEKKKPDLAVFTGDIVFSAHAAEGWQKLINLMNKLKTPYLVAFGNHDAEVDCPKAEALDLLLKSPYNLTVNADKLIAGVGNCAVPILSDNGRENKWIIYSFDSQASSQLKTVKGYDWIKYNQINWYRKLSASYTRRNNGNPLPSLAFFHIPLFEYGIIKDQKETLGNHSEGVCSPALNTGLFASFIEMNDVIGVFCGHDHNNDFIGTFDNICLAYGRKTGYVSAYKEILERGVRVIDLYENEPKFDTYIWALSGSSLKYSFEKNKGNL